MSEDPNHRRPSEQDFAAMLEATIQRQRQPRVEALFVWPIVFWPVLALGTAGFAMYAMSRG